VLHDTFKDRFLVLGGFWDNSYPFPAPPGERISWPHGWNNVQVQQTDGGRWHVQPMAGSAPTGGSCGAFDERSGVAVIYGGNVTRLYWKDAWLTKSGSVDHPGESIGGSMVFDTKRKRIVLWNGRELWRWVPELNREFEVKK